MPYPLLTKNHKRTSYTNSDNFGMTMRREETNHPMGVNFKNKILKIKFFFKISNIVNSSAYLGFVD